jgi:hypothetical protein
VVGVWKYAVETRDSVILVVLGQGMGVGGLVKRSFGRNVDDIETFQLERSRCDSCA